MSTNFLVCYYIIQSSIIVSLSIPRAFLNVYASRPFPTGNGEKELRCKLSTQESRGHDRDLLGGSPTCYVGQVVYMHLFIDILGRPWFEAIRTSGFFASQSSSPVVAFVIARHTLISTNRIPSQSRIPRELFTPFVANRAKERQDPRLTGVDTHLDVSTMKCGLRMLRLRESEF